MTIGRTTVAFIEPMLLEPVLKLPEDGKSWRYELKLDGYRAIAFKSDGALFLRSRNDTDFSQLYPSIVKALSELPNGTVIDGEIVALDEGGKPSFNLLQNHGTTHSALYYYVFDIMVLAGEDVCTQPLGSRVELLESQVFSRLDEPVRPTGELVADLDSLMRSVRNQELEGLVAKRRSSPYEPGQRSGAWQKMRTSKGRQEFVIGGYTIGGSTFDALVLGYFDEGKLLYVWHTRDGFTPILRRQLLKKMKPLRTIECPFANLPENGAGRWGQGLTAEKMRQCVWLKPELVGQFELLEWTDEGHLRETQFVGLREDKSASLVRRET